ncbi:MAG TPA: DUF4337 family protein [Rhizomicrobium sp.]|jgi:hypothetical protein|nr:DUF4337 family protein [Rhizomicrobium sp.]
MSHDPALEAHEHTEHAEHASHEGDPFVTRVAITVAFLAVLAAAAGSMETVEGGLAITASSEAVLAQDKATDMWNEYEADSLKKHLYGIAAGQGGPHADEYRRTSKDQGAKQDEIKKRALEDEAESHRLLSESASHERRHHWLTGAATLIEIGIALSTIAIITKRRPFWLGAMGLGLVGVVLAAVAFG